MNLAQLRRHLKQASNPQIAHSSQRFFKTGPGQYGEGDVFIGIKNPVLRAAAREAREFPLTDIQTLLDSKVHEERLMALMILEIQYKKTQAPELVDFYLKNTHRVNNWDLVDTSAASILGQHLLTRPTKILYTFAKSKNLWERRIAIISTLAFIRKNQFEHTLALAEALLADPHDLMHKAIGWMLREVGKRDQRILEKFLKTHVNQMPRTTLRYAIERFPEPLRQSYLNL